MKATGIVVEYNPFHNGHKYHIEKARQLTDCDVLVAVMSGHFVQRGEPAIVDKWTRTKTALDHGVDIVIELPFIFCNQAATHFAEGAIRSLQIADVSAIVFGSESNNLSELKEIAGMSINVDNLRESMRSGISYPKAYGLMAGEYYPNDILAIAYLKALNGTSITPLSIQRTSNYNALDLDSEIVSARAIRNALFEGENVTSYTTMDFTSLPLHAMSQYFSYLKTLLLTLDIGYLSRLFLFNEGIENHLVKQIKEAASYEEFIHNSITKRYSRARIQRTLVSLLCQVTQEQARKLPPPDTIRVLGFNAVGQHYLKQLRAQDVRVASRYNQIPKPYRAMEFKATVAYSMFLNDPSELLKREIMGPEVVW